MGNGVLEVHGYENRNSFSIAHRVKALKSKNALYKALIWLVKHAGKYGQKQGSKIAAKKLHHHSPRSWVHFTLRSLPRPIHSLQNEVWKNYTRAVKVTQPVAMLIRLFSNLNLRYLKKISHVIY